MTEQSVITIKILILRRLRNIGRKHLFFEVYKMSANKEK